MFRLISFLAWMLWTMITTFLLTCLTLYLMSNLFSLSVDLFASRLNYNLDNYVSWHADPSSLTNAFSCHWPDLVYLFPPLPLIDRVLCKFLNDNVQHGLLICPYWPSKPWFSKLLDMLIDFRTCCQEAAAFWGGLLVLGLLFTKNF